MIAEDRRLRRAVAKEGTPSSKKSLSVILAFTRIGGTLFQKILHPRFVATFDADDPAFPAGYFLFVLSHSITHTSGA